MRRLLAAAAASLALLLGHALPAEADYGGYRWDGKTICVEDRTTGARHTAVGAIVNHTNDHTSLAIWHRLNAGCRGFAHVIIIRQAWRSDWWWSATTFPNGGYICPTSMGDRTTCLASPAVITLNLRHTLSSSSQRWRVAHELGAALGLAEITWTCDTVMRRHHSACTVHPHALSWYDRRGTTAHPGLDLIYQR